MKRLIPVFLMLILMSAPVYADGLKLEHSDYKAALED